MKHHQWIELRGIVAARTLRQAMGNRKTRKQTRKAVHK